MILPDGSYKAFILNSNFLRILEIIRTYNFTGRCEAESGEFFYRLVFNNGYAVLSESGTGKSDGVIEEIKNLSAKDLFSFKLFEYSYDELTSAIEDNPEFVLEKTSLFSELAINSFEADLENLSNINIVDFEEKISKNMTQLLKDMDFDHLIPK